MKKVLIAVSLVIAVLVGAMLVAPAMQVSADGGSEAECFNFTFVKVCVWPLGSDEVETKIIETEEETEIVETEVVVIEEETKLDMTDTYRGFRINFTERSIGRVIVKETLVDGPAIHQDRDGNVTVVRKGASETFESGIIWLYKVGDANSVEDEILFLDNQVKWFNDPSPLWIEPAN